MIKILLPSTVISAGASTVPVIAKSNGSSSASLFEKLISPLQVTAVAVSNCTVKESEAPESRLLTSASVNVKPAGTVTTSSTKGAAPSLRTVNVRLMAASPQATEPKSVPSAALGVVSPSVIRISLPSTVSSGPDSCTNPVMVKLKGFSLLSFVANETSPVLVPAVTVSN